MSSSLRLPADCKFRAVDTGNSISYPLYNIGLSTHTRPSHFLNIKKLSRTLHHRNINCSYIIYFLIVIIIIIISGSTILVRTSSASHWRFWNLIKTLGRTSLDERSARRKGLYLHRTTQLRNTNTNIHAPSGIRTHDPSYQAAKT
jgi:hypothetical protein